MYINNFADSIAAQRANEALAEKKKVAIESRPGGLQGFRDNLVVEAVVTNDEHVILGGQQATLPGSAYRGSSKATKFAAHTRRNVKAKLREWYSVYEKCFPIPGERESKSGFTDILMKGNFDQEMIDKLGPYREFVIAMKDPQTGQVIGGLNFAVYSHNGQAPTMHSTYAFLDPEHRGLGLARKMFDIRDQIAMDYLAKTNPEGLAKHGITTFSEQNIPEKVDGLSYVKDSSKAVDQVKRLKIWTKLAYATIDSKVFRYIQPPLEQGGEPCDVLSLNSYVRQVTRNADGTFNLGSLQRPKGVSADTLYNHLRAFFSQSVVKDVNADVNDATTKEALAKLQAMSANGQEVRMVPVDERQAYLAKWDNQIEALAGKLGNIALSGVRTIREYVDDMNTALAANANAKPAKKLKRVTLGS